jgi:hypothetical protein
LVRGDGVSRGVKYVAVSSRNGIKTNKTAKFDSLSFDEGSGATENDERYCTEQSFFCRENTG